MVAARRSELAASPSLMVRALGPAGEILARETLAFETGGASRRSAHRPADRPAQPDRAARAGAARRRRRRGPARRALAARLVGLVGEPAAQAAQPLLSELYYVERALAPHAELRRGSIAELLAAGVPTIVLTDSAQIAPDARARLAGWIEAGGVLLRFAGPRLANAEDDLVPVTLAARRSHLGRRSVLGSAAAARPSSTRTDRSPTSRCPRATSSCSRQVLAQPGPQLAAHTWARLADGTPLITGAQRGKGWLVLVHTTANTAWSSLPLSGVFVDLLRPHRGAGARRRWHVARAACAARSARRGQGHLVEPGPAAQPVRGRRLRHDRSEPAPSAGSVRPRRRRRRYRPPGAQSGLRGPDLQASAAGRFAGPGAELYGVRPRST